MNDPKLTPREPTPAEKLDEWLSQFDWEEQERLIRYALDHVEGAREACADDAGAGAGCVGALRARA